MPCVHLRSVICLFDIATHPAYHRFARLRRRGHAVAGAGEGAGAAGVRRACVCARSARTAVGRVRGGRSSDDRSFLAVGRSIRWPIGSLCGIVRRLRPDVVHTWNTVPGMFGADRRGASAWLPGQYRIERWKPGWEWASNAASRGMPRDLLPIANRFANGACTMGCRRKSSP